MTSVKTAVSFPPDLFAALERQATREGLTRSTLVQRAVGDYLARVASAEITRRLDETEAALTEAEREDEAEQIRAWMRVAARAIEDEGW